MSNRNNVVFNVLPISSNTAILPKNSTMEALLAVPGKVGFFDAETNVSVDATSTKPKKFYAAVSTANGTFRKSAGQYIQTKGIINLTERAYQAGSPMVVTIDMPKAKCDTEYGIRVEFRNSRIYRFQGYNQYSKAFIVKTPCCDDCADDCNSYDVNLLLQALRNRVNLDNDNVIEAKLITPVALFEEEEAGEIDIPGLSGDLAAGATISDADLLAINTYNATAVTKLILKLVLTSKPIQIGQWAQVNLAFHKLIETVLIVSPLEDSNMCSYMTVSNQFPVMTEGSGANVMSKEYEAAGWNGAGPYVVSDTTSTPIGNIEYLANQATNYHQFALEHEFKLNSGFGEYEEPHTTYFALPTGNTDAITSLRAMLAFLSA
jgi:hypothetical protein